MTAIPTNWSNCSLADIAASGAPIIYGILQPGPDIPGGVPYVRPTEIQGSRITLEALRRTSSDIAKRYDRASLLRGDVLLSIVGTIGKVAIVPQELDGANITQSSCRIRAERDIIDNRFLASFLRSPAAISQYDEFKLGTAVPRLNLEDVRRIRMPVPPQSEQRRIVAKIDSLSAKSKRARDHLDHASRLSIKFRQAILDQAFSSNKNYSKEDWPNIRLGQVASVGTGATPRSGDPRYYEGGSIPWITSGAVNQRKILRAEQKITEAALRETNCKIFPAGTIVMAMYGEGLTRGKVAYLGIDAATNQAVAAIQVSNEYFYEPFLFWFLHSRYLHLRRQASGGVQPNLNLGIIKRIEVPCPAREEQKLIVRRIESALAWVDRLAAEARSARKLIDHLDQAVLSKAFRGELVPQDPDDEPASVLLERIKADRTEVAPSRRGRGRPRLSVET